MRLRTLSRSVRARAALGAVGVVGAALVVGSFGFTALLDRSLTDGVIATAEREAEALAAGLEAAGRPTLPASVNEDALVQLVDPAGVVVDTAGGDEDDEDADGGGDGLLPAPTPRTDTDTDTDTDADAEPLRVRVDGDEMVVVEEGVELGGEDYRLRLGRSLEEAGEAVGTAAALLAAAVPLVALIVGGTTWLVVGRALSPVDRIRAEVDAIGGASLDRRVAVPSGADEISRLAITMNGMLERLESAQRAQRRFVSDASHELRSPVASLRSHAEVARDHPHRLSEAGLASTVLAESARLQHLVEALLLLARLDERQGTPVRRAVDLDDLVLGEVRRLKDTGGARVDATGVSAARVSGDERMLGRLLRNLVDNAARHARHTVALAVRQDGDRVRLTVDDDGSGIPEGERHRIFDRFVRLDEARSRDDGGSGLGLAIVAEIARAHGGSVEAGTSPLGGARFTVTLPTS